MQDKSKESTKKRCIDGVYRGNEVVGYCWYKKHRGYLTSKLMKRQQCTGKDCRHFQKYEDSQYWKIKEERKQKKRDRKAEERARELRSAFILETARTWSDQYSFMEITSAREPSQGTIILTYFSNRYIDLSRCRNYISRVWRCKVELRGIKPDSELKARILNQKKGRIMK